MCEHTLQAKMVVASIAEHAHRYNDMISIMKEVVEMCCGKINVEQRELLVTAYKMAVQTKQRDVELIRDYMSNTAFSDSETVKEVDAYRTKIQREITRICEEIVALIDKVILPNVRTEEENVYFISTQGEFRSYILAINSDVTMENKIKQDYEFAYERSRANLKATDKLRLDSAFNMAMFYYKNLRCPEKALEIATLALEEFKQAGVSAPDTSDIVQSLMETVKLLTPDKDRWPVMVFH